MPQTFRELFNEAQAQQASEQLRSQIAIEYAAQAQANYTSELEGTRSAAILEASLIASSLITAGIKPDVLAVTEEVSNSAWGAQVGKPKMYGNEKSQRQLRRDYARAESIRRSNSFYVWRLNTSWRWSTGSGEDETIHTEYNYLGSNGAILHGNERPIYQVQGNYLPLRTYDTHPSDLERFTSVRRGLASLASYHGLNINI